MEQQPDSGHSEEPRLAPCPGRPNCVSSDARDPKHSIEPFTIRGEPGQAWEAAREVVTAMPRTTIVVCEDQRLHAECRSRLWRFVDDLVLELRPVAGQIAVRSAARVGYSDLGVNRRRVEMLRQALQRRGVIS